MGPDLLPQGHAGARTTQTAAGGFSGGEGAVSFSAPFQWGGLGEACLDLVKSSNGRYTKHSHQDETGRGQPRAGELTFDEAIQYPRTEQYSIWFLASDPGLANCTLEFSKSGNHRSSTMVPKCPSRRAVSWSLEDKKCPGSVPSRGQNRHIHISEHPYLERAPSHCECCGLSARPPRAARNTTYLESFPGNWLFFTELLASFHSSINPLADDGCPSISREEK